MPEGSATSPKVECLSGTDTALIRVTGRIDERFEPQSLAQGAHGAVIIDLDGVTEMTSYGVQRWLLGLSFITRSYLGFIKVRPALVVQFNSVRDFAASGQLISFYAPYVGTSCTHYFETLVDLRRQHAQIRALEAPPATCPQCSGEAILDDLPDSYFLYASQQPPPTVPRAALRWVDGVAAALRVDKEIKGRVTALWLSGGLDQAPSLRRLATGLEGDVVVVAQGVTGGSPEGVRRLAPLFEAPGARFSLARVPVAMASAMVSEAKLLAAVPVHSFELDFQCARCGTVARREVQAAALRSDGDPASAERCAACGGAGALLTLPEARVAAKAAAVPPESSEVSEYLRSRRDAPRLNVGGDSATPNGSRFGKYTVQRRIGSGGMAEVFLATLGGDGGFEKKVVLKRIIPALATDSRFLAMFYDEARLAARISHPNVVQLFEVGQESGIHYIAMEYVAGWDLNAILKMCERAGRPLPVELAVGVVIQLAAGLQSAHAWVGDDGVRRPIIHRDVSPHNVLVSTDGIVKVTDFGIAKASDNLEQTPASALKGKIGFMAPERFREPPVEVDARIDVFAAGVVLYQCLTLKHPFRGGTDAQTIGAIINSSGSPARLLRPEVPAALDAIVLKAMANDPAQRYQTARDLQQALEDFMLASGKLMRTEQLAQFAQQLSVDVKALGEPSTHNLTPSGVASEGSASAVNTISVSLKHPKE
ncbi:MAG: serine/threonine protein kinase [Archangiaceae bacterium]|nr:serine/threonine protein kinase [Archangiaceae bacterium]